MTGQIIDYQETKYNLMCCSRMQKYIYTSFDDCHTILEVTDHLSFWTYSSDNRYNGHAFFSLDK